MGHSLHIDGAIVMVDYQKALVNGIRLPLWFLAVLRDLDLESIGVDPRNNALNGMALASVKLLMPDSARWTGDKLDRMGFLNASRCLTTRATSTVTVSTARRCP